jgi:threonine synthase
VWLLEQFHGPTAAFKDHALQLLGNLFEYLLGRRGSGDSAAVPSRLTILGATSGDTGSAAIAGLRGKARVDVVILHPAGRVAPVQEMQVRPGGRALGCWQVTAATGRPTGWGTG